MAKKVPWARKIVTKWYPKTGPHDTKIAEEYHWACGVCGKEYEKQSEAWECCADKKNLPWHKKRN